MDFLVSENICGPHHRIVTQKLIRAGMYLFKKKKTGVKRDCIC